MFHLRQTGNEHEARPGSGAIHYDIIWFCVTFRKIGPHCVRVWADGLFPFTISHIIHTYQLFEHLNKENNTPKTWQWYYAHQNKNQTYQTILLVKIEQTNNQTNMQIYFFAPAGLHNTLCKHTKTVKRE